MTISDRLTRGVIAGIVAGVIVSPFHMIAKAIGLTKFIFADFAGVFIYGHLPKNLGELLFAGVGVLLWHSILGVLAAYAITCVSSVNYRLKSIGYGLGIWFSIYAVTILFKVPMITDTPLPTSITNALMSVLWGIILGETLLWLDRKAEDIEQ